jgi:hypothetical protein
MKTTNNLSTLIQKGTILLLAAAIFTSCKKDSVKPPVLAKPAKLTVVHASPGGPEFTFLINDVAATPKAFTYNTILDYQDVKAGDKQLSLVKKGTTDIIVKTPFTLKEDKSYTAFVTDKAPKAVFALFEDDLSAPTGDNAKIRFVNVSPDAPALDLLVGGKAEATLTKKAFKEATAFVNVAAAAEQKFEIVENGKTVVLATLDKVKIEKGKVYTIWVKGLKDATDDTKLGLAVMTNK